MPLNKADLEYNYNKVAQELSKLKAFYAQPDSTIMINRLDWIAEHLLRSLNDHEMNLNAVNASQLQELFDSILFLEDEQDAYAAIQQWINHKKKPPQPKNVLHYLNAGSIHHFKTALSEIIKTPEQANEKVVLLDPVTDINQTASAIKTLSDKPTTEQILVPLLCEQQIVWRLLIIKVNKNKITEAIFWDSLPHKTVVIEEVRDTLQKINPDLNYKKIHMYHSGVNKTESASHSFDFVVQKCVQLACSQKNKFWKKFCGLDHAFLLRCKLMELLANPHLGKVDEYVVERVMLFGFFPWKVKHRVPQMAAPVPESSTEEKGKERVDVREPGQIDLSTPLEQPRPYRSLFSPQKSMERVNPSYKYTDGKEPEPIWYHHPN